MIFNKICKKLLLFYLFCVENKIKKDKENLLSLSIKSFISTASFELSKNFQLNDFAL